jgi:hypothetical protein
MSKTVARVIFVGGLIVWMVTLVARPDTISDANAFLRGFVTHELLGFLAVVVTITLASAAQLHLALNQLEATAGMKDKFPNTRGSVRRSAYALLWALGTALILVVVKPMAVPATGNVSVEAFFNGAALMLVLGSLLTLVDLTEAAFKIR